MELDCAIIIILSVIIIMSISNLFVPNDLDLFCGTITTSGAGPGDTFASIILTDTTNQIVAGTSNLTTLNIPAPSGTITINFPSTADTLVGRATTDTLSNKTINGASNTLIVNSLNLNSTINQNVETTASPNFVNINLASFVLGTAEPMFQIELGAGGGASGTVTGSQLGGLVTILAGTASSAGALAQITLGVSAPTSVYGILLTAQNLVTANSVGIIYAAALSGAIWQISCTSGLSSGQTYQWAWWITPIG
jgi:hypothetical protein